MEKDELQSMSFDTEQHLLVYVWVIITYAHWLFPSKQFFKNNCPLPVIIGWGNDERAS